MQRLYRELKNQRFYYYVPPLILFLLVPLTVLATNKSGGGNNFPECAIISQLFIPAFAAWWPLFVLVEYLNSPGKEILFVYRSGRDNLFVRMILLWVFFILHVVIVFIYFTTLFDFVWFLFIAITIQSMFMIALAYFLSMLFQNTFIPLIIIIAYSSICMLALVYSPLSIFEMGTFADAGSLSKSPLVALITLLFFGGGYKIEKHIYKDFI